jgi:hypothetical protein
MGGPGSGFSGVAKKTVDEVLHLDACLLARREFLRAGQHVHGSWIWSRGDNQLATIGFAARCDQDPPHLRLKYTWGGSELLEYEIPLETTVPNFGGLRWWFRCPNSKCGRRAGKLYLVGKYFICRECGDLTYESCQKNHEFYALSKMLGARMGIPQNAAHKLLKEFRR